MSSASTGCLFSPLADIFHLKVPNQDKPGEVQDPLGYGFGRNFRQYLLSVVPATSQCKSITRLLPTLHVELKPRQPPDMAGRAPPLVKASPPPINGETGQMAQLLDTND